MAYITFLQMKTKDILEAIKEKEQVAKLKQPMVAEARPQTVSNVESMAKQLDTSLKGKEQSKEHEKIKTHGRGYED